MGGGEKKKKEVTSSRPQANKARLGTRPLQNAGGQEIEGLSEVPTVAG